MLLPNWPAPKNIKSAVTFRNLTGGVSQPPFDRFNTALHVGDNPEAVTENRSQLQQLLQLKAEPQWLDQIHGTEVLELTQGFSSQPPVADASYTKDADVVCVIQTADCLPVLFCNEAGTQVAAAHAGWRGLAAGVLENTLAKFTGDSPVMAWLGPAISQVAFEVGPEVKEAFLDAGNVPQAAVEAAFIPSETPGKLKANLYALARQRLQAAGVSQVYGAGFCTFLDHKRFYSYRRDGETGRMASLIWINA
ncbi:MAG: peptidoglycan editing factor PgeF [Cellvibrionaceae bacterium]